MTTSDAGCRLGADPSPISMLGLTLLIDTGGTFPQPGSGPATNVMAMVHSLAGNLPAFGAATCAGQLLQVMTNQAMFSLLGTSYGGDGMHQFGLPDLRGHTAVGGGPSQGRTAASLGMTYMIAVEEAFASDAYPMVGAIGLFAGNLPPAGWLVADGSVLPISQYVPLFEAIGATFGGNGEVTFQLPDLNARAVVGAGQGPSASIALGQQVDAGPDTPVSCLGLNYIVNVSGGPPPPSGNGAFPNSASVLSEVIAYAGPNIPAGWLPADGREMLIAGNEALFQLIGTSFGGNGETSFALPDLRTNMVEG